MILEYFEAYKITILTVGAMGFISIIQLFIVDLVSLKEKHTPGFPVIPDHKSFLFRATRAQSNTNESIAIFILLVLFGMFSSANPEWLNNLSILYVIGRVGHMLFYYFAMALARTLAFSLSLLGLIGMLLCGVWGWF